MSYYDNGPAANPAWPAARPPWDSRVGASPAGSSGDVRTRPLTSFPAPPMKAEDPLAFSSQIDEVDRAVENLVKSGKMYPQQRRDSMPLMAPRGFPQEHGRTRTPSSQNIAMDTHAHAEPRLVHGIPPPPRHYSVQDYDARPQSASNLQAFYANQRFQPRPSENEQVLQAKRRIAAQRERELRNYHQEQQYNRSGVPMMGGDMNNFKDRVISPGGMSEEERRELISRQSPALHAYAEAQAKLRSSTENHAPRPIGPISNGNNGPSAANSTRGPSPMSFDPFGIQNGNNANNNVNSSGNDGQMIGNNTHEGQTQIGSSNTTNNSPERSRTNRVQPQASRTTASSPTGGHDLSRVSTTPVTSGSVAPIGTRPSGQLQAHGQSAPTLQKRSTTPLPSPLSYGFTASGNGNANASNGNNDSHPKERSGSAASNASASQNGNENNNMGGWKVWGNNPKSLGTVASVWG